MASSVTLQIFRKTDTGPVIDANTILAATKDVNWRVILIEQGMESGQPSVAISIPLPNGKVVVHEISLLALIAAARGAQAMAEAQLGWKMPN
jgi:hypothetical protein